MSEAAGGEELPAAGIGELGGRQAWGGVALQEPLLGLVRQALRALDAEGSSLTGVRLGDCPLDRNEHSATSLAELLARIRSVLMLLGRMAPSWQEIAPCQIARFLVTQELQLQEELAAPAPYASSASEDSRSGCCSVMSRGAARRLRTICCEALGAAHDQLALVHQQPAYESRVKALEQAAEAVGRLQLLTTLVPAVFGAGATGVGSDHLSRLAVLVRRELGSLRPAAYVAGLESVDLLLMRLLRHLVQSLEGRGAGMESCPKLMQDSINLGMQRQTLWQECVVDADSRCDLSRSFLEELSGSLTTLRAEWRALSAKQGLRYLCGWHCAWVSRLSTAALICADVPRYDLLEAWRTLLCWQFEHSEPLRLPDLQLFEEVCSALVSGVAGTGPGDPGMMPTGMTAGAEALEARLAASLCVRELGSGVVPEQVPVSLARNIRALLTAGAEIRANREQPVAGRHLLVELRLLTAGARALGVYRVEALSRALAEVHLMLAGAGDMVLEPDRLDLLAQAHSRLCNCLNCAAAHQEVPDCRELIARLYGWLDEGGTGVASQGRQGPVQTIGTVPDVAKSPIDSFQREAVALMETIDHRIAELTGAPAVDPETDPEIPLCPQLLSLLHTLKGTALQFDCVAIADSCHRLEQLFLHKPGPEAAGLREATLASPELRRCVRDLRGAIDDLGRQQAVASGAPTALPVDDRYSLPVPVRALTRITGLAEHLAHCSRVMLDVLSTMELPDMDPSRVEVLRDLLAEQERHAVHLTEEIVGSRTVCFDRLSTRLQRLAARHANELDRQVWFQVEGAELQMDRLLLERLVAPLEHLLRNAIDHGIEPVNERRAASKPDCGTITLRVAADTGKTPQLRIDLADDGRGIQAGSSDRAAEGEDGLQRLFAVGFSTRAQVTVEGGHGLGLAAVKDAIDALKGTIRISTRPGAGTCFHIALPV